MSKLKQFTVNLIAGANVATVVLMLAAGYSDRIHPADMPLVSTLGMTFPFFLIANLLFLLFWLGGEREVRFSCLVLAVYFLAVTALLIRAFFLQIRYNLYSYNTIIYFGFGLFTGILSFLKPSN